MMPVKIREKNGRHGRLNQASGARLAQPITAGIALAATVLAGCAAKEARPQQMQVTSDSVVVRTFGGSNRDAGAKTAAWLVQALQKEGQSATLIDEAASVPQKGRYLIEGDVVSLELGVPTTLAVHARMVDVSLDRVIFDEVARRSSKQIRGDESRVLLLSEEIGRDLARAFLNAKFTGRGAGSLDTKPHVRKVLVADVSVPAENFIFVKQLEVDKSFYGSGNQVRDRLAEAAREVGADAVLETQVWFRPGAMAWAAPHASGKAVIMKDPCAPIWASIGGQYFPREGDTTSNAPRTRQCTAFTAPRPAPAEPPVLKPSNESSGAAAGSCTIDQVLAMKNAGLSDAQVRAACE